MLKKFVCIITRGIGRSMPQLLPKLGHYLRVQYNTGFFCKGLKNCGKNPYVMPPMVCNGKKYITIGDNFMCFSRGRIEAIDSFAGEEYVPQITIGNNVNINFDFHLGCINEISIGDNVLIGSRVTITDHNHGGKDEYICPVDRPLRSKGKVIIEDNVWIGENVIILPGVHIGKNAIIGAGAVVTKDISDNSIAVGNPAKVIKEK